MRKASLAVLALLAACSGGSDRSDVVDALTTEALVPLVGSAADEITALSGAVADFCSSPDQQSLDAAQASWHAAKTAWESAEVTVFYGPAPMLRTESKVDFEPVSPDGIEELLASEEVLDFEYVDDRSAASRRGLGTIEYLIFQPLEEASAPRNCELAVSVAQVASDAAFAYDAAWNEPTGDLDAYSIVFTELMEANNSLADVVGSQFEILNRQTLFELGSALGISSPEPNLDALSEGPAGAGVERYLAQLGGIEETLISGGESSLLELVRGESEVVAAGIEEHLAAAVGGLEQIDGSLTDAVVDDPGSMTAIFDELAMLRDLIHVDVVSLLDLTLGFSDSDGDSG